MLLDDLQAALEHNRDPLLKRCLNELILLNMIKIELESELLARGYIEAINRIKDKHTLES